MLHSKIISIQQKQKRYNLTLTYFKYMKCDVKNASFQYKNSRQRNKEVVIYYPLTYPIKQIF